MKTRLLRRFRRDAYKCIRLDVVNCCKIYKVTHNLFGKDDVNYLRWNHDKTVSFEYEYGYPGWFTDNLSEALNMLDLQRRIYMEEQVRQYKENMRNLCECLLKNRTEFGIFN